MKTKWLGLKNWKYRYYDKIASISHYSKQEVNVLVIFAHKYYIQKNEATEAVEATSDLQTEAQTSLILTDQMTNSINQ